MRGQEWPLVIFTVVAQAAIGALWWCCLALLAGDLTPVQTSRLEGSMLVIWAMTAVAFFASFFHLGVPFRALNACFRFGRAPLANEVVFGSAFTCIGLISWVFSVWDIGTAVSQLLILCVTVIFSLAFLASMISFYMIPTVPTWCTALTPSAYILSVLIAGSAVAAALFAVAGITQPGLLRYGPFTAASLAIFATTLIVLRQGGQLPNISSSITRASDLSPHYAGVMAVRLLILFFALGVWGIETLLPGSLSPNASSALACLILIAECVGRSIHFTLHMTVGLP